MKFRLIIALAAALVLAPAPEAFAADDPAAEKAKPKKKIQKKPFYTKFAEAMAAADSNDEPVLVLFAVESSAPKKSADGKIAARKEEAAKVLEKDLFKNPLFVKEYAKSNLVLLKMKLKTDKTGKLVDERGSLRTEEERRFVNEYGVDPLVAKRVLQRDNKKLKPLDMDNYPQIICVKGNVDKQTLLFRLPAYNQNDGFGPWLSSLHGLLQSKKVEPVVTPKVEKLLEAPTAFGGKKKR